MFYSLAASQVFLKDTDERACAYIAGPAPNRWGFTFEGKDLLESVSNVSAFGKFLQYLVVYELSSLLYTWFHAHDPRHPSKVLGPHILELLSYSLSYGEIYQLKQVYARMNIACADVHAI